MAPRSVVPDLSVNVRGTTVDEQAREVEFWRRPKLRPRRPPTVQGSARGHGASPRPRKTTARRIDAAYGWRVYARIRTQEVFEGAYRPDMVEFERACCTSRSPPGRTGTNSRVDKFTGPRARAAGAGEVQHPPHNASCLEHGYGTSTCTRCSFGAPLRPLRARTAAYSASRSPCRRPRRWTRCSCIRRSAAAASSPSSRASSGS